MKPLAITSSLVPTPQDVPAASRASTSPKFDQVLREKRSESTTATEDIVQHIGDFVDRVGRDQARIDRAISGASSGRDVDAVELLRIQALLYGQSQRVELASKCVQQATSGAKQLLNTQV